MDFLKCNLLEGKDLKLGNIEFYVTRYRLSNNIALQFILTKSSMIEEFNKNTEKIKKDILKLLISKTKFPWKLSKKSDAAGIIYEVENDSLIDLIIKKL